VVRRALLALAAGTAGFAALAGVALESGGVAVLETRAEDGAVRTTRVWVAESDGALLLEAATPERSWYRDVERDPQVSLARAGRAEAFRAVPEPGEAGHRRVRALLRERYGWRDAFVGLLQDTSRSVAVRLEPLGPRP
jgi:hypothetical protein